MYIKRFTEIYKNNLVSYNNVSLRKIIKIPEMTGLKTPTCKMMVLNPGCTLESFGGTFKSTDIWVLPLL